MDENEENKEIGLLGRPAKPPGDHEWCDKCSSWVQKAIWNSLHQLSCDVGKNIKPQYVPKVLVTYADWRAEFIYLLGSNIDLKTWQVEGAKTILTEHFTARRASILADEMGASLFHLTTSYPVLLPWHTSLPTPLRRPRQDAHLDPRHAGVAQVRVAAPDVPGGEEPQRLDQRHRPRGGAPVPPPTHPPP